MDKKINKKKLYMIISICLLCVAIIGSTVAYYIEVLFTQDINTITYGLDYYINYAKGQDISGVELEPTEDYTAGTSSDIELWKKDNTYDIYGHIYLDINEIGTEISKSSAVKYVLETNGYVIEEGTITGSDGNSILVGANIPLKTTKQLYTIYIWLDTNANLNTDIESEVLSLTVRCEATMKLIETDGNLLNTIKNLYILNYDSSKNVTFGDGTGMNYYAPSVNLMNDGLDISGNMTNDPYEGNIRYYGSNPDNYIYFNCSDYDNQSSSTCEKWRIIGIVDGKVKLIRDDSIGRLAWDLDKNQNPNLTTYSNNWETSSLQLMLNSSYYYGNNSGTITYYSGTTGDYGERITELHMSTIGIKNYTTRKLISESTWYLGGNDSPIVYPNEIYKHERTNIEGTTIYSTNPFTIETNIGLMYPSDYGFATDLSKCSEDLYSYKEENCKNNNWLFNGYLQWLITPMTSNPESAWTIWETGEGYERYHTYGQYHVRPTIYLDTEIIVNKGDGSSDNPYQIYIAKKPTFIEHITNLYTNADKTTVTNNSINYNYATSVNLMNDRQGSSSVSADNGNIRYYGKNPNNYIYFNCSDYDNQSSSTCEKWRIIGIVDGKIKIIRNASIGSYSWDNKNSNTGLASDNAYGSNNWANARLMRLLNPGYEYYVDQDNSGNDLIANNSLYWNAGSGKCFKGQNNATVSCNFTSTGLKNDTTRNLISESTWYLGGYTSYEVYSNEMYTYERTNKVGTTIKKGNDFSINAKAGLMYLSDYGYATDLSKCSDKLSAYNSSTGSYACRTNNWLFNSASQWTITNRSAGATSSFRILNTGNANQHYVFRENGIRPTFYLDPTLTIESNTDGSSDNPYKLKVS